jgi:hypothetical protein
MSPAAAAVTELLARLSLSTDATAEGLVVLAGRGLSARRTTIPEARLHAVSDMGAADRAAWARGVEAVLAEPGRSDAHTWEFVRCAATLLPQWERPAFAIGAGDAGAPPFSAPAPAGLIRVYFFELTQGVRLLSAEQAALWGAHPDRLDRAGLSILYHRTRHHEPTPSDAAAGALALWTGDGHDAPRVLLFEIAPPEHSRVYAAVPDQNTLVWVDGQDAGAVAELREWASVRFGQSSDPLTDQLIDIVDGRPLSESAPKVL